MKTDEMQHGIQESGKAMITIPGLTASPVAVRFLSEGIDYPVCFFVLQVAAGNKRT